MRTLGYSTALEEIAYSKSATALLKASDVTLFPNELKDGLKEESFYAAGVLLQGPALWFVWWGDEKTAMIFKGDFNSVSKKIRALPERSAAERT